MNKRNKRGQIYLVFVCVAVIFALVSSFILISYTSSEKSLDEYIGVYQSGMVDAIVEGDKSLIYLEQAAGYVVDESLQDYAKEGAVSTVPENGEEEEGALCGSYVYNLWNSESDECFPHISNPVGEYISNNLNEKLSASQDINLKKKSDYEYFYEGSIAGTILRALSDDKYTYYVFKSKEYKERVDVQQYVTQQQQFGDLKFSGTFIWPVPGYISVSSCFGYRGGSSGGTTYHAGLDIGTGGAKPKVVAAGAGTIEGLDPARWGRVIIDHGGGFKTEYLHLNSINPSLKVGDQISQGAEVGIVGGRGPKGPTSYPIHLHFTVINDNVNPDLNFKGAPAIKLEGWGNRNINPTCFMADAIKSNNVQFNTGSKSCQIELRDTQGNIVDPKAGGPFRFCDLYGSINPSSLNCQKKENTDWKITNIQVSQKEVSGDMTIKIITTVENPGFECASVAARPIFDASGQSQYVFDGQKKTDVYKDNQGKTYMNIETVCSFITDKNKLPAERGADKCVLLAPTDGSKMRYTVTANAKDAMGRDERGKTVTFDVTKPGTSGQTGNGSQQTTMHDFSMLISDAEFHDASVTQAMIQKFLERKGGVLKDPVDGKLPSQMIYDISKKNGISPILILVTLQKEQSLITAKTATKDKLNIAMGCGCPDVSKCDPKYFGFENQIKCAVENVYMRHFNAGLKSTYPYEFKNINYGGKCPKNSNTGQSSIAIKNAATYALYKYTPHTYDICLGDGKKGGGNYLFLETMKQYYKEITGKEYGTGTGTLNTEYQQVAMDEIEGKGIIGKYYVKPSFTVNMPFDLSLVDNLSKFMNQTVNECRISALGKDKCLDVKIGEFNNKTGKYYKTNNINIELTRSCDENNDERIFNEFIEGVEDCALSPDFDCQCDLKKGSTLKVDINSGETSSLLSFTRSGITYDVTSYNKFLDSSNNPLKLSAAINTINLYKKLGYLKSGTTNYKKCSVTESRFRLCLKTDYETKEYNGQALVAKNITLKFAITIADNDAPPPLTGLELSNAKHSKNSVIVSWDEPKKNGQKVPDVGAYVIYMSDVAADFNKDIRTMRNTLHYRSIDILSSGYDKLQAFDITQTPECEIVDDKYCIFKYSAKDSSGADIKMELSEDKLYYMIDQEKFFYILNGSDSYNALNTGRDKYIAVTAVDTDGNEIDNVNITQKITLGQNLQNIKPADTLEPGFVIATATVNTVTNRIYLNYERPSLYINGQDMDNAGILYRAYIDWDMCGQNQNNPDFCNVNIPFNHIEETGALTMDVDATMVYRIGVIPVIKKNNIDAQYNSGFTETIVGP